MQVDKLMSVLPLPLGDHSRLVGDMSAAAGASGYGHGVGGDGYGKLSLDHSYDSTGYGTSHSGYGSHGSSSYGKKKLECCPLVVDPLALTALLGFLAGATAFLNVLITMNIMGKRRRRRSQREYGEETKSNEGKPATSDLGDVVSVVFHQGESDQASNVRRLHLRRALT